MILTKKGKQKDQDKATTKERMQIAKTQARKQMKKKGTDSK